MKAGTLLISKSTTFAFDLVLEAIKRAGYNIGKDVSLGI